MELLDTVKFNEKLYSEKRINLDTRPVIRVYPYNGEEPRVRKVLGEGRVDTVKNIFEEIGHEAGNKFSKVSIEIREWLQSLTKGKKTRLKKYSL